MRLVTTGVLAAALLAASCREADGPAGPGQGGIRMLVTSEPAGARIVLDGRDTGRLTPDTIGGLSGTHLLNVFRDTTGARYEFYMRFTVPVVDSVLRLHAPLGLQCPYTALNACYASLARYHETAGLRFARNPLGSLFLRDAAGQGLFWPAASGNSYVSGGMPVFAALMVGAPVSLGVYDHGYLSGRPVPVIERAGPQFRLTQSTWVIPPTFQHAQLHTVRGIAVTEEIIASDDVSGVILLRLSFRNISADPDYRLFDPYMPVAGISFTDAYVGFALDPDIGVAGDDWLSYDPALDMVYAYDAHFAEPGFGGGGATAPGLVGLRALRVPAGAGVVLNGWSSMTAGVGDWEAGRVTEPFGYGMLSGLDSYAPAHAPPRVGHLPQAAADMRMSVTAGPLTLEPGAEKVIVLAVAIAPPAPGTFQSGTLVPPGDPQDTTRALYRIAAPLRARMQQAESLQD
jgi:hypothetical protein